MSAGYNQNNKGSLQKRLMKGVKIFLKEMKAKSVSMLVNNIEIFAKWKKHTATRCSRTIYLSYMGLCIQLRKVKITSYINIIQKLCS